MENNSIIHCINEQCSLRHTCQRAIGVATINLSHNYEPHLALTNNGWILTCDWQIPISEQEWIERKNELNSNNKPF
jgi:hypothetical protein